MKIETIEFNGWQQCVRLANDEVELIVTTAVGPRIVRAGFIGERNLFAELDGQGGSGEDDWMIRGGHRFWIAPEKKPDTYELDNIPIQTEALSDGVRTIQAKGPLSGMVKELEIRLAPDANRVTVTHRLTNASGKTATLAPWALSVMAPDGMAIIPLPAKIPHTERLTHNQEWSIWGYTDLTDPRWTFGSRYVFFRQDRTRGPTKLGIAHREGWIAYQLDEFLFVKHFEWQAGAAYPDGGVNFETFSNEQMLEIESLGPLVALEAGASVQHVERWDLHRNVDPVKTEDDADALIRPLV